jgi:uncharacterized membrane protein
MTGTRVGGAFMAIIGLVFIVAGPRALAYMRQNNLPGVQIGGENAFRRTIWLNRLAGVIILIAGIVFLIAG